jgi:hypothetical protein
MSLSRAEQREIVLADRERRIQREIDEYLRLIGAPSQTVATRDDGLALDYLPNRHRTVRASQSSWLQSRVVGIAPGTEATSDGTPTVKCTYADGTSEVRTVSSFRKSAPRAAKIRSNKGSQLQNSDLHNMADIVGYATELANE